jgi:hypothetical protein
MRGLSTPVLALLGAAVLAWPGLAGAQRLQSATLEPRTAKVGQKVVVTVLSDVSEGLNCNLRVNFGDGTTTDFKVNQTKDARYTLEHVYSQAGNLTLVVEPRTALPVLRCLGEPQRLSLTVTP